MAINAKDLSDAEIEAAVKKSVKGSVSQQDARERLEKAFSPPPLVWVNGNGAFQWRVFFRPFPDSALYEVLCER